MPIFLPIACQLETQGVHGCYFEHTCTRASENRPSLLKVSRHSLRVPLHVHRGRFQQSKHMLNPKLGWSNTHSTGRVFALEIKISRTQMGPGTNRVFRMLLRSLVPTSETRNRVLQKKSNSSGLSGSPYLSLNSFLVSHLASGIMVSFMSIMPLFFWSIWEASMTIRFRYSTDKAPGFFVRSM